MLFADLPTQTRPLQDFPVLNTGSKWSPPTELPSLKGVKRLGFDTETKDRDLENLGPGFRRSGDSKAYVVGMSLALDNDGPRMYIPVRHTGGGNLDEGIVRRWALSELQEFDGELVGGNLAYDMDAMAAPQFGVTFPNVKRFRDVLIAETILDEWRLSYSLDNVLKARIGEGKAYGHVHRVMERYGYRTEKEFKKNLWRHPASDVGEYAEGDAAQPLLCLDVQLRQMDLEDKDEGVHLHEVFDLESDLIPILVAMRIRGVRVDYARARAIKRELEVERNKHLTILRRLAGQQAEFMAPESFAKCLDDRGLHYPLTPKTKKPSITKEWLKANVGDEAVDAISGGRRVGYIIDTFVNGHIFTHSIPESGSDRYGRIHPTFKQLKGGGDTDEGNDDGDDTSGTIARFCLSGGTEIMVPGGIKLIEEIRPGNLIYSYDDDKNLTIQKVKWAGKTGFRKICRVDFSRGWMTTKKKTLTKNNKSVILYITPDHEIRLADGSYRKTEDLQHGDRVMALSRSKVRYGEYASIGLVVSVEDVPGLHEVYDIETEIYPNFIANEICVHNSCKDPNLQNIPARDPYLGPLIRSMFVPEEDEDWQSADAEQIEYRYLVNCAIGRGADEARKKYNEDPKTDFHVMCGNFLGADANDSFIRKRVKNTNFAKVYGGGDRKLAITFGCSEVEAIEFSRTYDRELPFVAETFRKASEWALKRGFIVTILGRKQRFPLWEAKRREKDGDGRYIYVPPMSYEDAAEVYGKQGIKRAWGHKALNRKLQGSGADHMKAWMVKAWKAGVHRVLGPLLTTVHDEGNNSVPRTAESREAAAEFVRCGETCISNLRVPILIKSKTGPNWGSCE